MKGMNKHDKIRVESWCKKFCQITNNTEWKKNRNLHAICLLDMILNGHYEEPYDKFAPEGPLPIFPKHIVKSRLTKKFWNYSKNMVNKENYMNNNNLDFSNIKRSLTPGTNSYRFRQNNKKGHFDEMINKCTNPDLLRKIIERLENKINKADEIIIEQERERNKLVERIERLEKIIKPYLNKINS